MDEFDRRLDAKYGAGKWHCDDLWEAKTLPPCVQSYLDTARAPAHGQGIAPPLFATHDGKRVKIVMASRFGDVGITENLSAKNGYSKRVFLPDLADFSDTSNPRRRDMEIKVGGVYRTSVATWTAEFVSSDGMIRFRREDGRTAWFGAKDFARWIVEKIN